MWTSNYSDEFKRHAVHQISVRGCLVGEVARHLRVNSHQFYMWLKPFGVPVAKSIRVDHEAENRRLKRELARLTEEHDILRQGESWCATGSNNMANGYVAPDAK